MDTRTEQAVETELQQRLLDNTLVQVHPTLGRVRFKRPNPGEDRVIGEHRRKQYQRDLLTSGEDRVLSKEEILRLAIERGMWSEELSEKIETLTQKTGEAMGLLDLIGFKSLDSLLESYKTNVDALMALYPETGEGSEIRDVIRAYYNLDTPASASERQEIADAALSSSVDDLLEAGDQLRTQIELLTEMGKIRKELTSLHARQTQMYMDSIESRADRAEELIRIYLCCTNADTNKPLWPKFEDILTVDAEEIEWLVLEMHYFLQGVTEEYKETLGKYGFIKRLSDKNGSSEDSHVQPPSNSAGESLESPPSISSEVTALTT